MQSADTSEKTDLQIPVANDAAALAAFIRQCPPLEANTTYAYLLFCTHFSGTSLIARDHEGIVGAIVGYPPPKQLDTLFVWQIGVHDRARGTGLAGRMLTELTGRLEPDGVRFVEATVAPSNAASDRLFRRFAERRGASCVRTGHFEEGHFGPGEHEAEFLYRIGPLIRTSKENEAK